MPSNLVDTTSFPLYTANALDQEHFLIAGGGGASKTGVPNMINVYKLTRKGKQLTATKVQQQDTGAQPVMNLDIHPSEHIIAAGMDNVCRLYHKPNIETTSDKVDKDGNKNTSNNKKGKGKKKQNKTEKEEIMPEMAVQQTAIGGKGDDEEYQKCVKFSRDGKFVITGASDGHVKIMQCPSLDIKYDIKAHTEEIDDLDVHPNSKKFVTVCRDCTSYLWRLDTGQKDLQLHFTPDGQEENSFKFRNCRFSHNTDENQVYMYTTHLPTKFPKNSPKPCNYLVKWDTAKWIPKSSVAIQKHSVTTLAVSPNGRYVAVGTADGSILIYISWNLRLLHKAPEIHNIFVTDIAFLPDSKLTYEEMNQDLALVSVSVDNTCHLTTVPKRSEFPFSMVLVGFMLLICLMFLLLSSYDVNFDIWK